MTLTRRLAAGLPAAGVAAFAALAFGGSPASAATADNAVAAYPAVMATPTCIDDSRTNCGYGYGHTGGTPGATTPTRGHPGYTTTPTPGTTTPTGTVDTVPPTGVVDTVPPGGESPTVSPSETTGGGVSAGNLPLTGAPTGATMGFGALLVAAGGAAIWYTRRRRTA